MQITTHLENAIESLYTTFAPYRLSSDIAICLPAMFVENNMIYSTPLRELGSEDVSQYSIFFLRCGKIADFKYLLPRYLDLFARGDFQDRLPEEAFSNLAWAEWKMWPTHEQEVIEHYLIELWKFVLTTSVSWFDPKDKSTSPFYPEELLCGIAHVADNLGVYFDIWESLQSPKALRNLAKFISDQASEYRPFKKILREGCWKFIEPQMHQLINWLFTPTVKEKLEQAAFQYIDEPFADELAEAVDNLDWLSRFQIDDNRGKAKSE